MVARWFTVAVVALFVAPVAAAAHPPPPDVEAAATDVDGVASFDRLRVSWYPGHGLVYAQAWWFGVAVAERHVQNDTAFVVAGVVVGEGVGWLVCFKVGDHARRCSVNWLL